VLANKNTPHNEAARKRRLVLVEVRKPIKITHKDNTANAKAAAAKPVEPKVLIKANPHIRAAAPPSNQRLPNKATPIAPKLTAAIKALA
jgi:hypothetical protein